MFVDVDASGGVVVSNHADDARLLEAIADSEVQARQADRRKLRYALEWAQRHIVTDVDDAASWTEAHLRDMEETLGGPGTPLISAGCVEPLATALGVSTRPAMQLLSDALDLAYRLPALHRGVEELRVAPWRARRIAAATHHLSSRAAAWVDARLAPVADSCGVTRIDREVAEAADKFDPIAQEQVADEARAAWGMSMQDYAGTWAGTSRLEFVGDTTVLTMFKDHVLATTAPGEEPIGERHVAALHTIASGAGSAASTVVYAHVAPDSELAQVEGRGVLALPTLQAMLGDLTGAATLIRPVLDLRRTDSVDAHDPPEWMRELVILRDRTCVFPYCEKTARACDLDHIEPYVDPDDGGPPGQTHPGNLAALCRRHHRAKAHFGWTYRPEKDGSYTWTAPRGARFSVDHRGLVASR